MKHAVGPINLVGPLLFWLGAFVSIPVFGQVPTIISFVPTSGHTCTPVVITGAN